MSDFERRASTLADACIVTVAMVAIYLIFGG